MRHFYIRLLAGILWLIVAVISIVKGSGFVSALYAVLGAAFLYSAWTMRGKNR